jgi:hypothetical protein
MTLTVRKLISELRKMPQTAKVAVCAHDQDPEQGEYDGGANRVELAPPAMKERGYGVIITL